MTVRTRVHCSADGWQRVRDELVDMLADRGVLHCPGAAGALLDIAVGDGDRHDGVATAGTDAARRPADAAQSD